MLNLPVPSYRGVSYPPLPGQPLGKQDSPPTSDSGFGEKNHRLCVTFFSCSVSDSQDFSFSWTQWE